ncbi:MAG: hypothetical protein ACUVR2_11285 [Anaerolineae bacterium]
MCGHGVHYGRHGYGCCYDVEYFDPWMHFAPRMMRFRRRFPTREERIAWLEEYLKELQVEAKAVEERIAELKAAG